MILIAVMVWVVLVLAVVLSPAVGWGATLLLFLVVALYALVEESKR